MDRMMDPAVLRAITASAQPLWGNPETVAVVAFVFSTLIASKVLAWLLSTHLVLTLCGAAYVALASSQPRLAHTLALSRAIYMLAVVAVNEPISTACVIAIALASFACAPPEHRVELISADSMPTALSGGIRIYSASVTYALSQPIIMPHFSTIIMPHFSTSISHFFKVACETTHKALASITPESFSMASSPVTQATPTPVPVATVSSSKEGGSQSQEEKDEGHTACAADEAGEGQLPGAGALDEWQRVVPPPSGALHEQGA